MSSTREFVPLRFEYNEARDVITIEGIAYHADLFRAFGFDSIGTVLRIDSRADGVVIFSRLYEPEIAAALDLLSACQQSIEHLEWSLNADDPRCIAMRAAIQKATGAAT